VKPEGRVLRAERKARRPASTATQRDFFIGRRRGAFRKATAFSGASTWAACRPAVREAAWVSNCRNDPSGLLVGAATPPLQHFSGEVYGGNVLLIWGVQAAREAVRRTVRRFNWLPVIMSNNFNVIYGCVKNFTSLETGWSLRGHGTRRWCVGRRADGGR